MQAYHSSFNPQAYSNGAAAAAAAAAYYQQHHNSSANYVIPSQYSSIADGFGYGTNHIAAAALANNTQVYNAQQVSHILEKWWFILERCVAEDGLCDSSRQVRLIMPTWPLLLPPQIHLQHRPIII